MTNSVTDPASVSGKRASLAETTIVLVIGAGPAGCAAAIAAAERGLAVVLVDENPVDAETMASDIPLHFGGRASGAVRNRSAMLQAVVEASPDLAAAYAAGVDVRPGTACWGLYVPRTGARWPDRPLAGLADGERCWHIGFTHAVVAAGYRDMGLAMPGWEAPGVMGAAAVCRLAGRYGALESRRAVVLGTGGAAMAAIDALNDAGASCAAVLECNPEPLASAEQVAALAAAGTALLVGHVPVAVESDLDGVCAIAVEPLDANGRRQGSARRRIACDTVVVGVAAIPCIELLDAAGCEMTFDAERGGHVPRLDGHGRTSLPHVYAIGDCAGTWPAKSCDASIARAEAERAVAALSPLEDSASRAESGVTPGAAAAPASGVDLNAYLRGWVARCVVEADAEVTVCLCEEVTARDILEVRPPRYLGWQAPTQKSTRLADLLGNGPPSPDQLKRLTRAGMGQCQGRRCREQVAALLALGGGLSLGEVPLASYRAPVRPVALGQLAEHEEDPELSAHWEPWFGIPSQWIPYWDLDSERSPEDDSDAP